MNIQDFFDKTEILRKSIIDFIDGEENEEENLEKIKISYQNNNFEKKLKFFLQLVSKIAKNHHKPPHFIDKIEQIILLVEQEIKQTLSNYEIYKIFKKNKRILLFLFNQELITMDSTILKDFNKDYHEYFQPEIENFTKENSNHRIPENFEENRKIGENETKICSIIRNDLIDDFIIYRNQTNIQLTMKTPKSIYETNGFKKLNDATLIEYAAFFGSIRIFKYLVLNNVNLNFSIWDFAIHGRNPEIIEILCDENIEPFDDYTYCYLESIKCYHNEIAYYLKNNFSKDIKLDDINSKCLKYLNFEFLEKDLDYKSLFYYSCKYDYDCLIMLFKEMNINVNKIIICKKYYLLILFQINLFCMKFLNYQLLNGILNYCFLNYIFTQ